ncbi:MAG: thiamine phosphate synthase [Epsilonproteobacteria bacterium]|nr:thiamine phosphate synthase [Campylobacterota bacterium]
MHTIYALFDYDTFKKKGVSFSEFLKLCKKYDAKIIQYRDKSSSLEDMRDRLSTLRSFWDGILIVNDRIELIDLADGLHLGQEDILRFDKDIKKAVKIVRDEIKDKILGLSTHNREEILIANELDLDYIGLGAYRKTSTKDTDNILGKKIEELAALSIHPVAAIGGVRPDDEIKNVKYLVVGSSLYDD